MARPATVIAQVTETPRTAAARKTGTPRSEETANAPGAVEPPRSDAHTTRQAPVQIAAVISSKIQAPVLRPNTLSRARLLDRLNESVLARVTLVSADAGYGKTTLLTDFAARSGLRTLWYRLDSADTDVITWTNYLIAAGREVNPDFGRATAALLTQVAAGGPPRSAYLASLLGEFGQLGDEPTVLILDDFHEVEHSAEVRELVGRLIAQAPAWLHLVIAARRRPSIEWARLAGMGELHEIGTDELRFSAAETERLFAESYGLPLEADVLRELDQRTRGWAASLQLFHGSIRGRPSTAVRALARSLSGASGPIYDFLAEEVLGNVSNELESFLVRCSILDRVAEEHVVALFADDPSVPGSDVVRRWIEESDWLGLLTRASQVSEARQLHPLLRDFLARQLAQRHSPGEIRDMHLRVAQAVADTDPLTACRHYIEAGHDAEAMACLGSSVVLTMGSGQWGVAAELIDRLKDVPANPAVAAIRARGLIETGDLAAAEQLLIGLDITSSSPDIRAVVRHARLSLGWRTGDRPLLFTTLSEMQADPETPAAIREIAQIFVDASHVSSERIPFAELARRLEAMARRQMLAGHSFYAAVSLHNAAIAEAASGHFSRAIRLGEEALNTYDVLPFPAAERYSTHALLAACWLELGMVGRSQEHADLSLVSGNEHGDVHADLAFLAAVTGERERAERLLHGADGRRRAGLSDLQADSVCAVARALMNCPEDTMAALHALDSVSQERPLDVGASLSIDLTRATVLLLRGDADPARSLVLNTLDRASEYGSRSAAARLGVLSAIASGDGARLRSALFEARSVGSLAILETADVIGTRLDLATNAPELAESISRWPRRWLPILRRQLQHGNTPSARAAGALLDEFGEEEDVIRLRAFAKTYGRRTRSLANLGKALARRRCPPLEIEDLGRISIRVGQSLAPLGKSRRKSASLLMYLATRPNFTATREQVLDELWPEADPRSATNSLNQALYFLRRDIDPWYEDDMAVDYVHYHGEVVWLDPELVQVSSVELFESLTSGSARTAPAKEVVSTVRSYTGQLAPEFEYEEWAMAWRARVHGAYLAYAHDAVNRFVLEGDLESARDVAISVLDTDTEALDLEAKLVWIYWHSGARSAAAAQYRHLASEEAADAGDVRPIEDLVADEGLFR